MHILSHGSTDPGRERPNNEDALFINEAHQVFAVADGLGGLPGGAEASGRIVELLAQAFDRVGVGNECPALVDLISSIHHVVAQEGNKAHPFTGTGSTLTIGQFIGDQLRIGHVGDSAAYRLRKKELSKLTVDHTMEQELIDRIGEAAHKVMPPEYKHILTRCIGQDEELQIDQVQYQIQPGDRILFCTDGLNKVLSPKQIQRILLKGSSPAATCQKLVDSANQAGGPDNITVIVLHIEN